MKNMKKIFMCSILVFANMYCPPKDTSSVESTVTKQDVLVLWRAFIKRAGFNKVVDYVYTPDEHIQKIIDNQSAQSSSQHQPFVLVALQAFEMKNPEIQEFKQRMREDQETVKECQEAARHEILLAKFHGEQHCKQIVVADSFYF